MSARRRILFVGPFNGGVGGMERLTRDFALWARGSDFDVTMVCTNTLPPGPFSVRSEGPLQVLGNVWNRSLARAPYDFVYVMPAGLRARRWVRRLRRIRGVRVVHDLDPKRKFLDVTDVLHCEAPRETSLPRPHVVAAIDPRPTLPDAAGELPEGLTPGGFDLTIFTPYGRVKGHEDVPRFAQGRSRPLVWCYDPTSFAERSAKYGDKVRRYFAQGMHPNVRAVRGASQGLLRVLLDACAGYVCFSRSESYGFAIADALAVGKPLASRRVGICHLLEDFRETEDFARPVFRVYPLPEASGFEGLFARLTDRPAPGAA